MSKTFFNIAPTNSATFFGWEAGQPALNFSLSNSNVLITKMKLQGQFVVVDLLGVVVNNVALDYQANQRTGAGSLIQQITISSNKLNQQLEQVRQVHRLNVSLNTAMNDQDDFRNVLSHELAPNNNDAQRRMINNGADALTNQTHRAHFSIEINSGILQSLFAQGGVFLGENLFGGLNIEIALNNSKTILSGAAAALGYEVRLYNPRLVGSYVRGLPPQMMGASNVKQFYTWSNFYNVINSNAEQVNINLGLSSVLSTFSNFIPTADTNTYLADSGRTNNVLGETRITYSKAGRRHPLQFVERAQPLSADTTTSPTLASGNARTPLNQISRNFVSAFEKYSDREREHSLVDYQHQAQPTTAQGRCSGIGVRYDGLSGVGESFQNVSLAFSIDSKLGVVVSNPLAIYTFVLNRNVIAAGQNQVQLTR